MLGMGKKPCRYVLERQQFRDKPRKILNLEERVQAIRMYDEIPVYQRVASAFKCSWEQIKNIVANRNEILKYYASCQIVDELKDDPKAVRHKKINFLGNCMFEYIKRAHYYQQQRLTDDVIREKGMEFKDIITIEKFFPNRAWIRDFKSVFNIDLDNIDQLIITGKPQRSLNCKDIITYCAKEVDSALSTQIGVSVAAAGVKSPNGSEIKPHKTAEANENGRMPNMNDVDDDIIEDDDDDDDDADDPMLSADHLETIINDEDIENEKGLTINYGNYDEDHDKDDIKPDLNELEKLTMNAIKSEPVDEEIITDHLNRQFSKPPASNELKKTATEQTVKLPVKRPAAAIATSVRTYSEALEALRPLEEFAIFQEDFKAINLLTQLAAAYEKAVKRKRLN